MPKIPSNERKLDLKIAQMEADLQALKNQKMIFARQRLDEIQKEIASLAGGGGARRGGKAAAGAKTRGGPRGPRLSDDEVTRRLTEAVKGAGAEGISARQAAMDTGVFYIRAGVIMKKLFKRKGSGKWTRFVAK
jgi:hypothetical protein